jgi:succinate-semialdehyde dehydrogenase / glutarate-semialdehyde dehydrogenase
MTSTQLDTYANFIDGRWDGSSASETFEVFNPATGEPVGRGPQSGEADVDQAVAGARRAFESWRWTLPDERAQLVHRLGDEAERRLDEIATAITREQGKPLDEARGEVRKLISMLHFYAEEATRTLGQTIPNAQDGFISIVEKEPVGVVAGIAPWNYPVELIGWKLAAALAAGCAIVVKPSEYTPGSAVALWRCVEAAGIPPGVANLVQGAGDTGRMLVGHPDVAKVAFTGSQATGEMIYRTVTGITSLSLELGGTCPMVVTATADLELAASGAIRRSFRNAGQICIAINRIYVEEPVYDEFLSRVTEGVRRLVVADGLENPAADVGAITTGEVLERTGRHVEQAARAGGRVTVGGDRPNGSKGQFYAPTVVADCTQDMLLMHEETFGPAVGVAPVRSMDHGIELANQTPSGLAAYAYSTDVEEVFALSRRLDFGNVAVNNVDAGIINAPYGGRHQSGIGYEHGREGLESYLQLKHVRLRHGATAPTGDR